MGITSYTNMMEIGFKTHILGVNVFITCVQLYDFKEHIEEI